MPSTSSILFFSALVASAVAMGTPRSVFSPLSEFHRRGLTGQNIAFACYGGGGDCQCPSDLNGDSGVLINVYPGYQCAYPNGACTWDDKVRVFVARLLLLVILFGYLLDWCSAKHLPDELSQQFCLQYFWWL